MIITPCKDCPDRYSGCHSKCERYIGWRKEFDEQKAAITHTRILQGQADARKKEVMRKMQNKRK